MKIIKDLNVQYQETGQKEIFMHPEIILNIAILRHKKGELKEAHEELKNLLESVEKLSEGGTNEKYKV